MGNVASRKNYGTPDCRIWGSRVHLNTRIVGKSGSDNRGRHGIRELPFPKDNIDQGGKGAGRNGQDFDKPRGSTEKFAMSDMPRSTGKEWNRTRLPNKEAAKDGLKKVRELLPSPGRKLRIPLGQVQEDVTVMLFKVRGLLRSPDQVGLTKDRSRRREVSRRRGELTYKCSRGRVPVFDETGNPKSGPGSVKRDTRLLNIIGIRMAPTLKRSYRKAGVTVIRASCTPRQIQLAFLNKYRGTIETKAPY